MKRTSLFIASFSLIVSTTVLATPPKFQQMIIDETAPITCEHASNPEFCFAQKRAKAIQTIQAKKDKQALLSKASLGSPDKEKGNVNLHKKADALDYKVQVAPPKEGTCPPWLFCPDK